MTLLKHIAAWAALLVLATIFVYAVMSSAAVEQQLNVEAGYKRCSEMGWPRPSICAFYAREVEHANIHAD